MFKSVCKLLFQKPTEDPRRMRAFRNQLTSLTWTGPAALQSMKQLRAAIDTLAEAEVCYYYRRRGGRRRASEFFRVVAWLLGTAGLLLPLMAATGNGAFKNVGQYGYPLLAGAASALGANSLFGGTSGHVRFVSTQLALEKLITSSAIEWSQFCAVAERADVTEDHLRDGFELLGSYATAIYGITISETNNWAEMLVAELSKFQKTMDEHGRTKKQ